MRGRWNTHTYAYSDENSNPNSDTHAYRNTKCHADGHCHANSYTYSYTYSDSHAYWDTECDTFSDIAPAPNSTTSSHAVAPAVGVALPISGSVTFEQKQQK